MNYLPSSCAFLISMHTCDVCVVWLFETKIICTNRFGEVLYKFRWRDPQKFLHRYSYGIGLWIPLIYKCLMYKFDFRTSHFDVVDYVTRVVVPNKSVHSLPICLWLCSRSILGSWLFHIYNPPSFLLMEEIWTKNRFSHLFNESHSLFRLHKPEDTEVSKSLSLYWFG